METSNSEFILLILINEHEQISGYQINTLIKNHGYREWAGIGATSIYKGLKKLEQNQLVESTLDVHKTTKGPVGRQFTLTDGGRKQLRFELKSGLSETREHNPRFKIALSGSDILRKSVVCNWLGKRVSFLQSEIERLESKKGWMEHQVLKVQMMFEHSLWAIQNEVQFTEYLIKQFQV